MFNNMSTLLLLLLQQTLLVYTPPDHRNRITDRCYSLVYSTNVTAVLNMSQCYHYSKENENQLDTNECRSMPVLTFFMSSKSVFFFT